MAASSPSTKMNAALIKSIHKHEIESISSKLNVSDTEAILSLTKLQLDGQNIARIEHLELFDQVQELYLHHNIIQKIENVEFLRKLRVLSLAHNQIKCVENISHLKSLEVLDLSMNQIDFLPDISVEKENKIDKNEHSISVSMESFVRSFPPSLQILDLRGNPCVSQPKSSDKELRRWLVKSLPFSRMIDGEVVRIEERKTVLESFKEFDHWCASSAGRSRKHVLYIELKAEFEHEVDRKVRLTFCDGDNLDEVIRLFQQKYNITSGQDAAGIKKEMIEMIDYFPASRLGHLSSFKSSNEEGKEDINNERSGSSDRLSSFTQRIEAFYRKYDTSKINNAASVAQKYGQSSQSQQKLIEALVTKYGPEPVATSQDESKFNEVYMDGDNSAERARQRLAATRERLERNRAARAAEMAQTRAHADSTSTSAASLGEQYLKEVRKAREVRKLAAKESHEKMMSDAMERISKIGEEE